MKRALILLLLLAALAAFGGSCKGEKKEKPLSVEDYYTTIGELDAGHQGTAAAIATPLQGQDGTQALALYPDIFVQENDELSRYIDDLTFLVPPTELTDAHYGLLDALEDLEFARINIEVEVEDATSLDEVQRLLSEGDAGDAVTRAVQLCGELEQRAAAASVQADLNCEELAGP